RRVGRIAAPGNRIPVSCVLALSIRRTGGVMADSDSRSLVVLVTHGTDHELSSVAFTIACGGLRAQGLDFPVERGGGPGAQARRRQHGGAAPPPARRHVKLLARRSHER